MKLPFLNKVKELQSKSEFLDHGILVSFQWKGGRDNLNFPLSSTIRKEINQWAPEKAMALYSLESLLMELGDTPIEHTMQDRKELGISADQLDAAAIEYRDGKLFISYLAIYTIVYGDAEETGLDRSYLQAVGVPAYDILRVSLSPYKIPRESEYRVIPEYKNQQGQVIELIAINGHVAKDTGGNTYFLSPSQAGLVLGLITHKKVIQTAEYKTSGYERLREVSRLQVLARRAQAQLHKIFEAEEIIILEDLDYVIGRDVDGEVVLEPVMPKELANLDQQLQQGFSQLDLNGPTSTLHNKKFKLTDEEGRTKRILFSPKADQKYEKIRELRAKGQETLEQVIEKPEEYLGTKPRSPLGETFSDRVCGFVFGSVKQSDPDQKNNTLWGQGFEGDSVFLKTQSGASIPTNFSPTPSIYREIKMSLDRLADAQGGALSPDSDGEDLHIDSLNDKIKVGAAKSFLKRIEATNIPNVEPERISEAETIIEDAKLKKQATVQWKNEGDEEFTEIPLKSLEKSISRKSQSGEREGIPVPIASEATSEIVRHESNEWVWGNPQIHPLASRVPMFREEISLRPHQEIGFSWLKWIEQYGPMPVSASGVGRTEQKGCLIADDMGVGKTIQVLALIATHLVSLVKNGESILIVAPVSLLDTSWTQDGFVKFFAPGSLAIDHEREDRPSVVKYSDCPFKVSKKLLNQEIQRVQQEIDDGKSLSECDIDKGLFSTFEAIRHWAKGKIILTSYESMVSNSPILASINFKLVVLDEAQGIKNVGTLRSFAAKTLKSDMCVAMTGTPIENSIIDLWNIVDFAVPGFLGDRFEFGKSYRKKISDAPAGSPERQDVRSELEGILHPIWMRRSKKDVQSQSNQLPQIFHYDSLDSESGERTNKHMVQMSDPQFALYQDAAAYFHNSGRGGKLEAIQRMLQLCSAPWLREGIDPTWENREALFGLCPKLESLVSILEGIRNSSEEEGRKVLLFCNLLDVQRSLSFFIKSWHLSTSGEEIVIPTYNGTLKIGDRRKTLDEFKEKKGFQVLIISPKSGGVGLNLQQANHVIHYTREWNPAIEKQATDRSYRFGQTRDVHVYYPTTSLMHKGIKSAEEHLAGLLAGKREIVDDFTLNTKDLELGVAAFGTIGEGFQTTDPQIVFNDTAALQPYDFEALIAKLLEKEGFETYCVGQAGDFGADVLAFRKDKNLIIQCKHTKRKRPLGAEAIGDVLKAKSVYERQWGTEFELVAVTNLSFSEQAHRMATQGHSVELWESDKIKVLFENQKIMMSDLKGKLMEEPARRVG